MKTHRRLCVVLTVLLASGALAEDTAAVTALARPRETSWFIEQSARLFTNLGHAHLGATTAFGVRWKWLSAGLGLGYRPAAWDGTRYPVALPEGETYRGQSTVFVATQFGFAAAFLMPSFEVAPDLGVSVEFPVFVGFGFLGTPLSGDDRKTPMGERVSTIENRLLNEADLGTALAVDVGARLRWTPRADLGISLLLGVHYTEFVGYGQGFLFNQNDLRSVGGSLGVAFSPR